MKQIRRISAGPFEADDSGESHFESLAKTNGSTRHWQARKLMAVLGYDSWATFRKKVINRAVGACMTLGISVTENFAEERTVVDGVPLEDLQLTRFACCLIAMNGDPKRPNVAAAQAYFAFLALTVDGLPLSSENVERILMRDDISEREVSLNKVATAAGVEFYDRFANAGYRGMYNMDLRTLKQLKGVPDLSRPLLDYMGKDELAGNLFRLTLTEGRIQKDRVTGQQELQHVAEQVGRRVRSAMIEETGKKPEELPIGDDIKIVKKSLKATRKGFAHLMDNIPLENQHEADELSLLAERSAEVVPECPECFLGHTPHFGSPQCTSGSLAAGGNVSHCECDFCSETR